MNKIAPLAAASFALTLILAGCSPAPPDDTGKTPETAPVASADPTDAQPEAQASAEPAKSSRGNLVKQIGELAGTTSIPSGVVTSRFAVTDIVVDPECTSGFADAPANGHFLGIHMNIETTPELADEAVPFMLFGPYDWQAYDGEGKRLNDPMGHAWSCFDSGQLLPAQIGPGQSVSGWVVLDVAATTGSVVMTMAGGATGWEWSY